MSKKVFLTGATGLIGKETLPFLKSRDCEIYALSKSGELKGVKDLKGINIIKGDLFDKELIKGVIGEIKPEYLLHFAWYCTGTFESVINYEFLSSSLDLLTAFGENGGKKAVMAGTYAEYGYYDENLKESFKTQPINTYSACKDFLHQISAHYCDKNNIAFGWGRIFSAFGLESDPRRLTSYVVNNLLENKQIVINSGSLIRDYIYSKDASLAFVEFLFSDVCGALNICTGKATSIKDYVLMIARILGREDLVEFKELPSPQQVRVVGDITRLSNELNFRPRYELETALNEVISLWGGERKTNKPIKLSNNSLITSEAA